MPNFETFTKRLIPLVKQPSLTIQKRGTMSINKAAHVALGEPEAVELLYDADEKIIGIRGVDREVGHAYPLRGTPNDSSYVLSGRAFTAYYGIPTVESTRFEAAMIDDVLCVDLNQSGQVVTSNRRSKREDSGESDPADTESGAAVG